jgi:hypothetical protein
VRDVQNVGDISVDPEGSLERQNHCAAGLPFPADIEWFDLNRGPCAATMLSNPRAAANFYGAFREGII